MKKVFIDGSAGTTGLRIYERLADRTDIELMLLSDELRKDTNARREALNSADIAFLCLPDAAAVEAVSLVENDSTVIIDTSTAHRCAEGWAYGFPELTGYRERIASSKRIANPGCHASGFIALIAPLAEQGLLSLDAPLCCTSLTGYSGGGKKMIAEYEAEAESRDALLDAPRQYGLSQSHKHLPEMVKICRLERSPAFMPIVAPFYSGMEVSVPLFPDYLKASVTKESLTELYTEYYKSKMIRVVPEQSEGGFLSASSLSGRDIMEITVHGNNERLLPVVRFDNLGKGASGAAIQNMNIVLGLDETAALAL